MGKPMRRDAAPEMVQWGKAQAEVIRNEARARGETIGHGQALEMAAKLLGFSDWNRLVAAAIAVEKGRPVGIIGQKGSLAGHEAAFSFDPGRFPALGRFGWPTAMRIRPGDRLKEFGLCKHTVLLAPRARMAEALAAAIAWIDLPVQRELPGRDDVSAWKVETGMRGQEASLGLTERVDLPEAMLRNRKKEIVIAGSVEPVHHLSGLDVLMAQARAWRDHILLCIDPSEIVDGDPITEIAIANASSVFAADGREWAALAMPESPWEWPWIVQKHGALDVPALTPRQERALRRFLGLRPETILAVFSPELSAENIRVAEAVARLPAQAARHARPDPDMACLDPEARGWLGAWPEGTPFRPGTVLRVAARSHAECAEILRARDLQAPLASIKAVPVKVDCWPRDPAAICQIAYHEGHKVRWMGDHIAGRLVSLMGKRGVSRA